MSNNLGICLNNIACIHARLGDDKRARHFFKEAIRIEEQIVASKKNAKESTVSADEQVKLGLRYFNLGYFLYSRI